MGRSRSVIAQAGLASMGRAGSSHLGNVARWGGQSGAVTKGPARNDRPARSSQTAVREAREFARCIHSYPGVGRRRLGGSPPSDPDFLEQAGVLHFALGTLTTTLGTEMWPPYPGRPPLEICPKCRFAGALFGIRTHLNVPTTGAMPKHAVAAITTIYYVTRMGGKSCAGAQNR